MPENVMNVENENVNGIATYVIGALVASVIAASLGFALKKVKTWKSKKAAVTLVADEATDKKDDNKDDDVVKKDMDKIIK